MTHEFSQQLFENSDTNFHQSPSDGVKFFQADGRTWHDMTKVVVAFRNFVHAAKNFKVLTLYFSAEEKNHEQFQCSWHLTVIWNGELQNRRQSGYSWVLTYKYKYIYMYIYASVCVCVCCTVALTERISEWIALRKYIYIQWNKGRSVHRLYESIWEWFFHCSNSPTRARAASALRLLELTQ